MYCPSCGTHLTEIQRKGSIFSHRHVSLSTHHCQNCHVGWRVGYDSQDTRHVIIEVHLDKTEVGEDVDSNAPDLDDDSTTIGEASV